MRMSGQAKMWVIIGLAGLFGLGIWAGSRWDAWPARLLGAASGLALAGVLLARLRARVGATPPSRGEQARMGLFLLGMAAAGVLVMTLYITYNRAMAFVTPPRTPLTRTPESVGIQDYREVTFTSADGLTLRGWYIPPRNGGMVVFANGHGANRSVFLYHAALLAKEGYGALLYDLRNTGESDGTFTSMGYYESRDVLAAVQFAASQPEVDPGRIALVGDSMGGSATLLALPELPEVRGVVIECSFSTLEENIDASVRSLGLPKFPFGTLVSYFGQLKTGLDLESVRPVDSLREYHQPVLIIHGDADDFLPVRNGYALYEAANEPKELYIVAGAGHCGFEDAAPEEYPRRLMGFLRKVLE